MSNETQHTPEPWNKPLSAEYSGWYNMFYCLIRDQNDNIQQKIFGKTAEEAEANAERIVKCVNDCEGIENPKIYMSNLAYERDKAREERDAAEKQIKELLAALELAKSQINNWGKYIDEEANAEIIDKAINNAKPKTDDR